MAMMLVRRVAQRALVLASESRGAGVGSMRTFAAQSADGGSDDANPDVDTTFEERKDVWADQRREWNKELNEQRKRWAADFAAEAKQEEARLKAERARIEEEKAERQRLKGIRRTEKAVAAAKREKVRLREKERELRVKTVQRRQKEFVMHLRRTAREEELLIDSRNWVTRETLDSRIERALKNPRELYDPRG
jgi:hypothetical protein|mmetsp:Transcript_7004/g.31645  ORF Transcript_7004/g.31645 Transcript_7004/m.31645 type:complete len:193 (+) Transcript_7004:248-826(+)